MFTDMLDRVKADAVSVLSRVQIREESELEQLEARQRQAAQQDLQYQHASANPERADADANQGQTYIRNERKIGRNEPCPCGSGKKYKQCHGKLT